MANEHLILCGGTRISSREKRWRGAETIYLSTGKSGNVNLSISDITRRMAANLPPVAADLIDIATYVYCADQASTRGGVKSFDYGQKWRREFRFEIPVRLPELWKRADISDLLKETLGFLSDDDYQFVFSKLLRPPPVEDYLEFDKDTPETPFVDEVVLFSGGLDSFGGAVEEILVNKRKVALVSHRPVSKILTRQRNLVEDIKQALKDPVKAPLHVPVLINKDGELGREYTQRTRSLLFAAIGAVVAQVFQLNRIRFYENGVISLNLPWTKQAIGARASRTTHPRVLNGFAKLFSLAFNTDFKVENPFIWKTKTEVLLDIKKAGYAHLCAGTSSCAHTWDQTIQHSHCGRCSQCVDRRMVALAAGFGETEDPSTMYASDVLRDELTDPIARMLGEYYMATAHKIEKLDTPEAFCAEYPEISRLLRTMDGMTSDAVATKVFELYRRHARQVSQAFDAEAKRAVPELSRKELPENCLLRLVLGLGARRPAQVYAVGDPQPVTEPVVQAALEVDAATFTIRFNGTSSPFDLKSKLLFSLLKRISERPSHAVYFATLREKGGPWDGAMPEDSTIKGAVGRLCKYLKEHGLSGIAACISTGHFEGKPYVTLDLSKTAQVALNSHPA